MEPREAADFESFCVVVPMYNEAVGAELCVKRICKDLSAIAYRCELVVVEDGSSDVTASILDRLSAEFGNLTVINHANKAAMVRRFAVEWNTQSREILIMRSLWIAT